MVLVLQGYADPTHQHALDTMFEDRKRLFVDLLGWDVPVVDHIFEIDQYDGPQAVYLIAIDAEGAHAGSPRLLPSRAPHILDTLFPELCDRPVPTGPTTFEITRLCLPPRFRAADRLRIRNQLISAMVDHALDTGLAMLTGVVTASFREEVLAMGWRAVALGPPQRIEGARLGAFALHLDADTPQRLEATGLYTANTIAGHCPAVPPSV